VVEKILIEGKPFSLNSVQLADGKAPSNFGALMKKLFLQKETLIHLVDLSTTKVHGGTNGITTSATLYCAPPSFSNVVCTKTGALSQATVTGGCSAQTYCQQATCACAPKTGQGSQEDSIQSN
jgi:FAD/FMN-containing dehydrogenase